MVGATVIGMFAFLPLSGLQRVLNGDAEARSAQTDAAKAIATDGEDAQPALAAKSPPEPLRMRNK